MKAAPDRARGAAQAVTAPRRPARRDPPLGMLALQGKLGNAGVARLVQRARAGPPAAGGPRLLARFAGPEHEALGNTLHTNIDLGHGVTLTWGQVLAIAGDEIGTIEELLGDPATEAGRHRIGASLLNAELTTPLPPALKPTPAELDAHHDEFLRLAFENADHFPDSGRAVGAWAKHHAAAISDALAAGFGNNPRGMNTAYAREAFGQHFLTDCYSGGHIRTPRAQIIDWYLKWGEQHADALIDGLANQLVAALVLEASPQTALPDAVVRWRIGNRVRPAIEGALQAAFGGRPKFRRLLGLGVGGAISGAIHDTEGAAGVLVASDDHPEPWRAYGDGKLNRSPASFEQAAKAVAAAKADVDRANLIGAEEGASVLGGSELDSFNASLRSVMRARAELGPPYRAVARFIPRPVEERGGSPAGKNAPLAEWHWGQLSWKFVDVLNDYIRSAVGSKLRDGLANSKDVRDVEEDSGITVHPRRALEQIVRDFTVRPVETVGGLIGQPGYAPSPTPAGAKTPPIAPPEPGEEPVPDPSVPWPYGTPLPY
jgi:hypothetical protein